MYKKGQQNTTQNNSLSWKIIMGKKEEQTMAKMIAAQRQQKIVELLKENGGCKIADLALEFDVSKETIRRDLIYLNEIGAIQKSYGGAVSNYELHPTAVSDKLTVNQEQKLAICRKALELIPEKAILYLDTGSTITCLAGLLAEKSGLTLITNSLSAANALNNTGNAVYLTGGQLNFQNQSVEGYQTTDFLNTVKVEAAFLGTSGYDQHQGPTTIDFLDAQAKQTMLRNAKKTIVLADSSKSTLTAMHQYATWHEIDCLVTDSGISEEALGMVREYTQVVVVPV